MQRVNGLDLSALFSRQGRRDSMDAFLLDQVLPFLRPVFSRYWGSHFSRRRSDNKPLFASTFPPVLRTTEHLQTAASDADEVAFNLMPTQHVGSDCVSSSCSILKAESRVEVGGVDVDVNSGDMSLFGCGHNNCCLSMTVDGHEKCTRMTCMHKEAFLRDSDEVKGLWLQCPNEPM